MQEVKIRTSANTNLWPELWRTEWHSTSMKMAETAFGPIVFGPFEYSAQTDKIHYSAQFFSAQSDSALSNSAQRSTTARYKFSIFFLIQVDGQVTTQISVSNIVQHRWPENASFQCLCHLDIKTTAIWISIFP